MVSNEIADSCPAFVCLFLNPQAGSIRTRIDGGIDMYCWTSINGKIFAAGTDFNSERGTRKSLNFSRGNRRWSSISSWWCDLEPVVARCDQREAVSTGWRYIGVAAGIGRCCATDHAGRVAADTVITKNCRGKPGCNINQGDRDSVDRLAGTAVKNQTDRVDQNRNCGAGPIMDVSVMGG